jgi:hypothetical protein
MSARAVNGSKHMLIPTLKVLHGLSRTTVSGQTWEASIHLLLTLLGRPGVAAGTQCAFEVLRVLNNLTFQDNQRTADLASLVATSAAARQAMIAQLCVDENTSSGPAYVMRGVGGNNPGDEGRNVHPCIAVMDEAGVAFTELLSEPLVHPDHARVIADALLPAAAVALQRALHMVRAQYDAPDNASCTAHWPANLTHAMDAAFNHASDANVAAVAMLDAAPGLDGGLERLLASEEWPDVPVVDSDACCGQQHVQAAAQRVRSWLRDAKQWRQQQQQQLQRLQQQQQQRKAQEEQQRQQPAQLLPLPRAAALQAPAHACAGCGVIEAAGSGVRLRLCRGCRQVRYCGEECMRGHWASHRPACKAAQAAKHGVAEAATTKQPV